MNTIYYLLLLVLTAIGSSIMTAYAPAMLARLKRLFTRTKRQTQNVSCVELEARITELKTQIDNVAANNYRREQNRKSNIRREVRDYLEELKK